jgi:hypothetical protein
VTGDNCAYPTYLARRHATTCDLLQSFFKRPIGPVWLQLEKMSCRGTLLELCPADQNGPRLARSFAGSSRETSNGRERKCRLRSTTCASPSTSTPKPTKASPISRKYPRSKRNPEQCSKRLQPGIIYLDGRCRGQISEPRCLPVKYTPYRKNVSVRKCWMSDDGE